MFIFPFADASVQLAGRGQVFRPLTAILDFFCNDVPQGESDGFQPTDQHADDGEAQDDFWSVPGNHFDLDVLLECRADDRWNVHGGPRTGYHQFRILEEKAFKWLHAARRTIQPTSSPHDLWPDEKSSVSKAARRKYKQHWATEKPEVRQCSKVERHFLEAHTCKL